MIGSGEGARAGARGSRRRSRRPANRRARVLLVLAGVVLLAAVAVVAWYEVEAHPSGPAGARVVVQVPGGEGADGLAQTLQARGVVSSALAFRLSLLVHGTPAIEAGGYVFHRNQSFATVRSVLATGPDIFSIDVVPGYTVAEVANALGGLPGDLSGRFEAEVRTGAVRSDLETPHALGLEGLLGTGTYQVLRGESAAQVLTAMVDRFERQAAAAGLTPAAAAAAGMTPYQLVTVASIAQKEGYYDEYMGKVARVIYNRLARGMPLDMTSTVLYALGQDGGTVTPADRALASPYNTYLHTGLTPTPICLPSQTALAAAAAPPAGTWLYFTVVNRTGKTLFADTYTQQLANERGATTGRGTAG